MNNPEHMHEHPELQALKSVQLTSTEKEAMKSRLIAYADMHEVLPKTATGAVVSPLSRFSYSIRSAPFLYSRTFATFALVIVLLAGSTGVTFAAQNTLPGQPLYVVKVAITEPIQTALITDPTQKATWQNTLAERRLIEASTLAAQNNLASSTQEYLAAQVTTHVQASEEQSDQLAASGDASAALQIRGDLEARLAAHADLLSLMATRLAAAGDATTTAAVESLLQSVTDQQIALQNTTTLDATTTLAFFKDKDTDRESAHASSTEQVAIAMPAHEQLPAGSPAAAEGVAIHTEEARILKLNAPLLALLPAVASTSTSTVATSTATATSTTSASNAAAIASSTIEHLRIHKGPWLPGLKIDNEQTATTTSENL